MAAAVDFDEFLDVDMGANLGAMALCFPQPV